MTTLLEYEAKQRLVARGLSVPEGAVVVGLEGAVEAAAALGYPVMIKAQVHGGDRAARGLVHRVEDESQLRRTAAAVLAAMEPDGGAHTLLVERCLALRSEWYVAVATDRRLRRPCLLTSRVGGSGVEERSASIERSVLPADADPTPWAVRELARRHLGCVGPELLEVSAALSALLRTYREDDAWLVEVNPLGQVDDGGWVGVDAKIRLDGDALLHGGGDGAWTPSDVQYVDGRAPTERERQAIELDRRDHQGAVHLVEIDPGGELARAQGHVPVAMHCVGTGASLTLMDELVPLGFAPTSFCDTSGSPSFEKVHQVTRLVLEQPGIEGYVFLSSVATQELTTTARGLLAAFRDVACAGGRLPFPILVVLRGNQDEEALTLLREAGPPLQGPDVALLGRDTSERDAAARFAALHSAWGEAAR